MSAISNNFDMFFRAHDYASRVIGNINVSMAAQIGNFVQMGYKIPLVSRNVSAAMVVTAASSERYIRDLKEIQKYSKLSTTDTIHMQQAVEQTGGSFNDIVDTTNDLWEVTNRLYKLDNQVYLQRLKMAGIATEENTNSKDQSKLLLALAEHLGQYKEGMDRVRESIRLTGNAQAANLAVSKAQLEIIKKYKSDGSMQASFDKNKVYMEENKTVLLELTMTFKKLGMTISEIMIPVLTVLIESFTMTIKIIAWFATPILAILKLIARKVMAVHEWIAALGILGKIILWVAIFCIGFYIRQVLLMLNLKIAIYLVQLGGAWKTIGETMHKVGKIAIDMKFMWQGMIVNYKDTWKVLKLVGRQLKFVASGFWRCTKAAAAFAIEIVVVIGIIIAVWEIVDKLAKLLVILAEKVFTLTEKFTDYFKDLKDSLGDVKKFLDDYSVEGVYKRISNAMGDSVDKAKEANLEYKDTLQLSKEMYDSLGDMLERATNLPSNVIPALAERMKQNKTYFDTMQKASIEMGKVGRAGMLQGPQSELARANGGQSINVEISIDRNTLGEFNAQQAIGE